MASKWLLIFFASLFLLFHFSFVSSSIPYIYNNTNLGDGISSAAALNVGNLTLSPNFSAISEDLVFLHTGGSDSASFTTTSATWGSNDLSFTVENGSTRDTEAWHYVVNDPGNFSVYFAADTSSGRRIGQAGRIVGVSTVDWFGASSGSGQNVVNNVNVSITTTRNNSLIVGVLTKSNTEAISTDATSHLTTSSGTVVQLITLTKEAPTIGTYSIAANWSSSVASVLLLYEVRSPGESEEPQPDSSFVAENITSNKLTDFATSLMATDNPKNILIMGDSLAVPHGWLPARWSAGFLKTFNHTAGYHSITTGAGLGTNPAFIEMNELATFTGNSTLNAYITTNDYWKDGSYYGGIWTGRDLIINVANDGFTEGSQGNVISYFLKSTGFNDAVTSDWLSNKNLSLQFGYLYDSSINYVSSFVLKNGSGNGTIYKLYNVTNSSEIVGDSLYDQGLNLLKDKITVDTGTNDFYVSNLTGSNNYFFAGSTIKISDDSNPNGIDFSTLAQSSTSYADTYADSAATSTKKYYKRADLRRYLSSVYNRNDSDNFVFIMFAAEGGSVDSQIIRVNNMLNNISEDYYLAGLDRPKFALVSSWRGDDENETKAQAEIFYNVSNLRSDTALISMYGLTQGIYLNGSNSQQTQWAVENEYDRIVRNTDTLNITEIRMIDTNDGVHQNNNNAAFFFAYLLSNEIYDYANGTLNPGVTINSPTETTYSSLPLIFNVTLSEYGSVNYTLDGGLTNYTMGSSDNINFNASNSSIANGNYNFTVYALDDSGNANNTEFVQFTVSISSSTPSSSSLEPSGDSSARSNPVWYSTGQAGNVNSDSGNSFSLREKYRARLIIDHRVVYVGVLILKQDYAEIQVNSGVTQQFKLDSGQSKKVDTDFDDYYDLLITLDEIDLLTAKLTAIKINEEVSLSPSNQQAESNIVEIIDDLSSPKISLYVLFGAVSALVVFFIVRVIYSTNSVKRFKHK